jgi:hypothetical protein
VGAITGLLKRFDSEIVNGHIALRAESFAPIAGALRALNPYGKYRFNVEGKFHRKMPSPAETARFGIGLTLFFVHLLSEPQDLKFLQNKAS